MQISVTTLHQLAQPGLSRISLEQSEKASETPTHLSPLRDRIELSQGSKRSHAEEPAVEHLRKSHHDRGENRLFDFLKGILEQISGGQINDLQQAPPVTGSSPVLAQGQQDSLAVQQTNLSVETSRLTIGGSITTSDGSEHAFSLDLQVLHVSANTGAFNFNNNPDGYNFSYAGSSAELTSTSFSFSLTTETPDGTTATGSGLGAFLLKDQLKELRHSLKPFIKDLLQEAEMPSDKGSVSQLLKAIV
jgi:hypothetical protein